MQLNKNAPIFVNMENQDQFVSWLKIQNFKSVKNIKIDTKRVNIFIGEPNSGKSNILESLFYLSVNSTNFQDQITRAKDISNIAFDSNYNDPISLNTNLLGFQISQTNQSNLFKIEYTKGDKILATANVNASGYVSDSNDIFNTSFKYYSYKNLDTFSQDHRPFLAPPFGQNLPYLLLSNPKLKKIVSEIFSQKGFRLVMKPVQKEIEIVKDKNDELYSYPYHTTSETLRRYAFMRLAIESNKDSVLIFDEPEANTFPFYSKMVAELIGADESNQYFIATHSPYLLMSLIEKTPLKDLNIVKTEMIDFETRATSINPRLFGDMLEMGSDIFYELERLS
ncbi:MAG: AAA family ATPase [Bacteroidetes bacterium]|nr:AAA family ATPase [Bacteroidota bacterium]